MSHQHHNHSHNHFFRSEASDNSLVKFASYASVFTALIIIIIKLIAWIFTDSVTILASLVDSTLDIASSIINLIAIKYALQPPDNEHRFGHGKAEDLAVFTQSAFFGVSGIFLIIAAIQRFFTSETIKSDIVGIYVMVISIIITTFLIIFQKYVIKKTKSHVISADHLHYTVDLLSNIAVIAALMLHKYFHFNFIDPVFALIIAAYIMYSAWKLLIIAFNNLMDHEFNNEEKQKIYHIIKEHKDIRGIHDLKTRYAGSKPFIQFHLQLDPDISLIEAHNISHEIENNLLKSFPKAEILIHQDPEGADEEISYHSI